MGSDSGTAVYISLVIIQGFTKIAWQRVFMVKSGQATTRWDQVQLPPPLSVARCGESR